MLVWFCYFCLIPLSLLLYSFLLSPPSSHLSPHIFSHTPISSSYTFTRLLPYRISLTQRFDQTYWAWAKNIERIQCDISCHFLWSPDRLDRFINSRWHLCGSEAGTLTKSGSLRLRRLRSGGFALRAISGALLGGNMVGREEEGGYFEWSYIRHFLAL